MKSDDSKLPNPDDLFKDCPEDIKQLWREAKQRKREKARKAWKARSDFKKSEDRAQYE